MTMKYVDVLIVFCTMLLSGGVDCVCRFPGAPAHSNVLFSNQTLAEGTVASYVCDRGFELLGPSRRVCNSDGTWTPDGIPFCVLNVAAGKAPMQSSNENGGVPQKALDGSTSDVFTPETCTLTKIEPVPWWYVNLLEPYMVQLVRLDFGKSCCGTNKPAVIVVRVGNNRPDLAINPICNKFTGFLAEGQPLFLPCNPPMPGAFVSVHMEAQEPSQLSICEAFIYTDQALPIERCPQFRDLPPGSTATYNGKCYIFYSRKRDTFRDAQAFCRSRGGSLIVESNPALQGFVSWELWRRHRTDSSSMYWLGALRDPRNKDNWKWITGEDVEVSFWHKPVLQSEDCVMFDSTKGWLWDDTNCMNKLNYICQHQPKACGRPEQPPNSTMVAHGFEVGDPVEYSCDPGHLLVGPPVRVCLETGFYDEFPPVCKNIVCGYPADIQHGSYKLLNNSVSYLSHVQYSCDNGFEMTGRSHLVCDIDERWNGPPPRCEAVVCEYPQSISNGRVVVPKNITTFGSTAEYSCVPRYTLNGSAKLRCMASGKWDSPPPKCEPDAWETSPSWETLEEEDESTSFSTSTKTEISGPRTSTPKIKPRITTTSPVTPALPSTLLTLSLPPTAYTPPPYKNKSRLNGPTVVTRTPPPPRPTKIVTDNKLTVPKVVPVRTPPPKKADAVDTTTIRVPQIIVASHPRENQILGSGNNIRAEQTPRVNVPEVVDEDRREPAVARFNIGVIVFLGVFGVVIFIISIVTTVVTLVRRNFNRVRQYRHHEAVESNTVASLESSSSESPNGLNRYYRQAWEELHESAGNRRVEREAPNDVSELVVNDSCASPGRDHHHHHRRTSHQHSPRDEDDHCPHDHRIHEHRARDQRPHAHHHGRGQHAHNLRRQLRY